MENGDDEVLHSKSINYPKYIANLNQIIWNQSKQIHDLKNSIKYEQKVSTPKDVAENKILKFKLNRLLSEISSLQDQIQTAKKSDKSTQTSFSYLHYEARLEEINRTLDQIRDSLEVVLIKISPVFIPLIKKGAHNTRESYIKACVDALCKVLDGFRELGYKKSKK